jgi:hypothetical protein
MFERLSELINLKQAARRRRRRRRVLVNFVQT